MKFLRYIEAFKSLNNDTQNTYLIRPNISFNKALEIKQIFNEITENDFIVSDKGGYMTIIETSDKFKSAINILNTTLEKPLNINISFTAAIEYDNFNRIDFESGIPDELKGLKIGYKVYMAICKFYGYISTMDGVTHFAKNLWYSIVHDSNFFVIVNKKRTLLIDKGFANINAIVEQFLKQYPESDLDPELNEFLNGKMDINK